MLSLSCLPFTAGATVVLYATQDDALPQTDIPFEVVYLDAPERLLDEVLLQPGTELKEADAPHITALLQSPAWQAREAALRQAYQGGYSGLGAGGDPSAGGGGGCAVGGLRHH
ncbi:hypothetical protein PY546_14670 [Providencia stuartii]|nr:hypothetical protein [Providencia stuartii]